MPERRRSRWYCTGKLAAAAFKLIPYRWRFAAIVAFSKVVTPVIRRTTTFREWQAFRLDTAFESVLFIICNVFTRHGLRYGLPLRLDGWNDIQAAVAESKGVFIAAPHAQTTIFALRGLYDAGTSFRAVAPHEFRVLGTTANVPVLVPQYGHFLTIAREFRRGHVVLAMIDTETGAGYRAVSTVVGTIEFTDSLLRLARRQQAKIFFISGRFDDGEIVITFNPADALTEASVADGFAQHIEMIATRVAAS